MKERLELSGEGVANLLAFLAEGVREGRFAIRQGAQLMHFQRASIPLLRIKASRKPKGFRKYREKLKIVLNWKEVPGLTIAEASKAGSLEAATFFQPEPPPGQGDELIIEYLKARPQGAALIEMGEALGENWRKLIPVVTRLIHEGKLLKEGRVYKIISGSQSRVEAFSR